LLLEQQLLLAAAAVATSSTPQQRLPGAGGASDAVGGAVKFVIVVFAKVSHPVRLSPENIALGGQQQQLLLLLLSSPDNSAEKYLLRVLAVFRVFLDASACTVTRLCLVQARAISWCCAGTIM
jgi:hypothetical protein